MRLVLYRIRLSRSLSHHGGALSGGTDGLVCSSFVRSGESFVSCVCRLLPLLVVPPSWTNWCWCKVGGPTAADLALFPGYVRPRSGWGMSSADTPHRQVPILQVWSLVHNAFMVMALTWILDRWYSTSFSGVRLDGAGDGE
ncbi:hypothetical protein BRADI_3g04493v3 [Brachypodium distachyon]|uniref:Uncharacterized protein n=1 Tax=Brachypodium distachyon TaxID=15368 RepID=A0A2K2CV68_BRADI|nr:hypothetical protein BRADI_3g04493v3 [Brachypodium distachyon]